MDLWHFNVCSAIYCIAQDKRVYLGFILFCLSGCLFAWYNIQMLCCTAKTSATRRPISNRARDDLRPSHRFPRLILIVKFWVEIGWQGKPYLLVLTFSTENGLVHTSSPFLEEKKESALCYVDTPTIFLSDLRTTNQQI